MPGMQGVKLAEHHADVLLHTREFEPQKTVQRFELLRAGAFDFGVQQLAQVAFGHAAGVSHLLQRAAFLTNGGFDVVK